MSRALPVRKRAQSGFTIVEIMVAAFVLSLAIGSSLIVLARGFGALDSARRITYASQIMQSEMEKMRLTTWGDGTTAGTGTTGITKYKTTWEDVEISVNFFSANDVGSTMKLQRRAEDVHDGMIKVTFTISWKTYDGRPLSRSYTTYYGRDGLYDFFSA